MKILSSSQIRLADQYTIENEPISSIDLMERAAKAFVLRFNEIFPNLPQHVLIFCGTGNNGGDGLAIGRLLFEIGSTVTIYKVGTREKATLDFKLNFDRLPKNIETVHLKNVHSFPEIDEDQIIIDGLFGSGLSRSIEGLCAKLIAHINSSNSVVVSIDIASGLSAEGSPISEAIIVPTYTISFQLPKLVFFQPSLSKYVGNWHVVNIGLNKDFIQNQPSNYCFTERSDVDALLPTRTKFNHKGNVGRLLLIAGSKGKMGAAALAARAAFRSGVGLLYVQSPACGMDILQTSIPEAMVLPNTDHEEISEINIPPDITAIAIGPGIGTNHRTMLAFKQLLLTVEVPLVIDADAINLLSLYPDLIKLIPKDCLLTPHPGEFKRLVGEWKDDFHKLELLRAFCINHQVHLVLKGAYSAVCNSDGQIYFNSTGNPGMATAGSGDVLTGIIGALLSQAVNPFDALRLAVYLHGHSGDIGVKTVGEISLQASDIIRYLPAAFLSVKSHN